MLSRSVRVTGLLVAIGFAAGCGSDRMVTEGTDEESLATEFDGLSQDATIRGDGQASAAFSGAAMSLRLGIRPSAISVSVDGQAETYSAFVHVVGSGNPAANGIDVRTLVAFRVVDRRPRDVLYVALTQDSLDFIHPASARPGAGGISSWNDIGAGQIYLAIRGFGAIVQQARAGTCPKVPPRGNVTCTAATFGIRIQGGYHALIRNQRGQIDPDTQVIIGTRASGVNGAVLTFN